MDRPLWQLLLAAKQSGDSEPLTCDECFTLLEYLAELADFAISEKQALLKLLQQHQIACPDCQAYYLQKLREWERQVDAAGLESRGD